MQLNITGCEGAFDSGEFLKTILEYKRVWSYIAALLSFEDGELSYNDIDDLFTPEHFYVSFGGNTYTIVDASEVTEEAYTALDAMLAYSKDFHTFDFIQDNIKIDVDLFENTLYIKLEEKE